MDLFCWFFTDLSSSQVPRGSVLLVLHGSLQQSGEIKFIFLLLLLLRRAIIFQLVKNGFLLLNTLSPMSSNTWLGGVP